MKIPTFIKHPFVDKQGNLTPEMQLYNDELNVQMQNSLSDDGIVIPSRTTADINYIASNTNANARPDGTLWYDTDTNELKAKVNGAVRVIQLV